MRRALGEISFSAWISFCSQSIASKHVKHLLATVSRVADQALLHWVDHKIKEFQRHLPNQSRAIVRNCSNLDVAVTALDCKPNHAIRVEFLQLAANGSSPPCPKTFEPQLFNQPPRQRKTSRSGVHQGVANIRASNLLGLADPLVDFVKVHQIFNGYRNHYFSHGGYPHRYSPLLFSQRHLPDIDFLAVEIPQLAAGDNFAE